MVPEYMKVLLSDVPQIAMDLAARLPQAVSGRAFLVFLQGDLGAGKTTFMQHFAQALGVTEVVQSPTFVLMKSYSIARLPFNRLVHIDAYRLEGAKEFEALKPREFLKDPGAIVCVEWPEKVGEALAKPDLVLRFAHADAQEDARDIEIMEYFQGKIAQ